ncbi:MAG: hypothetical protein AABY02_02265 [Nanoarchaeota archaeon]
MENPNKNYKDIQTENDRKDMLSHLKIGEKITMRLRDGPQFSEPPERKIFSFAGRVDNIYLFCSIGFECCIKGYRVSEIDHILIN